MPDLWSATLGHAHMLAVQSWTHLQPLYRSGAMVTVVCGPGAEPFILCGPDGVGKTTIAQQLVLHLVGAIDGPFLGLSVQSAGRVLYLACDRPPQALRSFRRCTY
jgi:RecA-family ATPase